MKFLTSLIDANQLGGWARAAVAALLGSASGWLGGALVPFLTPEVQAAIGLLVSTAVVGVWSSLAKKAAAP
ncbi:hypothetical protein [Bradyrhizobium sp.]|uniref:hypothetical protein n=1 Tax=Bradyrhizobium sp. TaxID=376 RepID=UPI0025C50975|nr:hypothetical protein [Bradyrhizobium sp.]